MSPAVLGCLTRCFNLCFHLASGDLTWSHDGSHSGFTHSGNDHTFLFCFVYTLADVMNHIINKRSVIISTTSTEAAPTRGLNTWSFRGDQFYWMRGKYFHESRTV